MRPDALFQVRRIGLDPSEDRGVCDGDAAVLQHKLEIAVADGEHQVPADRPEDHLGGELPTLERQIRSNLRQPLFCHALAWPRSRQAAKDATEPVLSRNKPSTPA